MNNYRDTWTDDHGEDGLREKFGVYEYDKRLSEPSDTIDMYVKEDRLGATGEFVFTLRPESDHEAWAILHEYADRVEDRAPKLAEDIRAQLRRIELLQDQLYD